MAKIRAFTAIRPLLDRVTTATQESRSLEAAAQVVINLVYEEFSESIVLTRLFATVPFAKLPGANRGCVTRLGETQGISELIRPETLVLSQLGTRGIEPAWNDAKRSA
ncbi:MAG: hypothetical protein O3B73_03305 [bacterium]|nr:hypothetical protein [bacterium]